MQGNSRRKANTQYLRLPSPSHPSYSSELPSTTPFPVPATNFLSDDVSIAPFPPFARPLALRSAVLWSPPPFHLLAFHLPYDEHCRTPIGQNISTLDCFLMPEILRGLCSYCVLDLKGILGALYIRGNPNIYSLVPTKEFFKDENDCLGCRGDGSVRKSDCPSSMMTCVWISAPI